MTIDPNHLAEATQTLLFFLDLEHTLTTILKTVTHTLGCQGGGVAVTPNRKRLPVAEALFDRRQEFPLTLAGALTEAIGRQVVEHPEDQTPFDLRKDERLPVELAALCEKWTIIAVAAPLGLAHKPRGALVVWGQDKRLAAAASLATLQIYANLVMVALENTRFRQDLERENIVLKEQLRFPVLTETHNPQMRAVYDMAARVAKTKTTVFLRGESGTGKEVLARYIHDKSPRRAKSFVPVNCAALPESLLESELFGHERGAFTGAVSHRQGRFELAHEGTIFLDEIGEMSPATQTKFLRVLQEREFERVGGTKLIPVDVRVIAATNRDLDRAVADGAFREDLFYRLSVFPITLPMLRERREDVEMLAHHFLEAFAKQISSPLRGISPTAMKRLMNYAWPGNIRELANVIERAVVVSDRPVLEPEDLPVEIAQAHPAAASMPAVQTEKGATPSTLEAMEKEHIQRVLQYTDSNKEEAFKILGISRSTLYEKLKRYGLR